jgi:hypothetical protein
MSENRIEQTTPAKSEPPSPSQWGKTAALVAAILGGAAVAVGTVLAAPVVTPIIVLAAALSGAGGGALGYFGLRSSGPK